MGREAANSAGPAVKLLRLRYDGVCESCGRPLRAGTSAWHDRARRKIRCQTCPEPSGAAGAPTTRGTAGASAAREYERRSQRHHRRVEAEIAADARWREQARRDHPVLGRLATALTVKPTRGPEPHHVTAWKTGADGERKMGACLDRWAHDTGGVVLHDRRIPPSRANIDHIAINSEGVWVIDTKEYKGKVTCSGGLLTPRELGVAGRRKTHLAAAVRGQMQHATTALDTAASGGPRPPVHGVLCFVGAEWPLIGGTFAVKGITVAWPTAVVKMLTPKGRPNDPHDLQPWAQILANAFPSAC